MMETGSMRRVLSFATITALGLGLGRVSGLAREMVVSAQFGLSAELDAYFLSFLVPAMINNIVAGGSITLAVMPTLTRYLASNQRAEFWRVASLITNVVLLVSLILTLLGIALRQPIIALLGGGLAPATQILAADLLVIMMPTLFISALLNMFLAMLNALNRFGAPALIFLALNLGIIVTVVWLAPVIGVAAVAWGFLIGVLLQTVIQLIELRRARASYHWLFDWRHPALTEVARAFIPITALTIVQQINLVVDKAMAATLPAGSISALAYADTILGSFYAIGIALSIAVFPSLSRMAAVNDFENTARAVQSSLRMLIFVLAPLGAALIPFAPHAIGLLLARGRFDAAAVDLTAAALVMYALGLVAIAALYVLPRVFNALGAHHIPLGVGAAMAVFHFALNAILMREFAHAGIALSTSLTAFATALVFLLLLKKKLRALDLRALFRYFFVCAFLAALCALAAASVFGLTGWGSETLAARIAGVAFAGASGALYFFIALAARIPESALIAQMIGGFLKKK